VDSHGETALLFFSGPSGMEFSHSIRKGPMLAGPDSGADVLYMPEEIAARTPSAAEHEVARAVLDAAPRDLLYARVDLIPGPDGLPVLVELELTEPSVFLGYDARAASRFATAIASHLSSLLSYPR
jgi:hypothetical protein